MENKVLLLDDLGKKYGETHVYHNLKTPAEAIKLLCINYPQFAKDLATSHEQGIFYKVQQVDIDLELSDLFLPLGSHDLVVTPVISGSGDVGKILLGVGLIFATGGFGSFGTQFFGKTFEEGAKALLFTKAAANFGGFLVLSGITGLITPQPTLSLMDTEGAFTNFNSGPASLTKGADGMQTFAYTGATNSSGLGKTIPVAYGKVLAGSLVIGAQIEPDGEDDKSKKNFFRQPGLSTFTINGDKPENKFRDCGGIVAKFKKPPKQKSVKKQGKKGNLLYVKNKTKNLDVKTESEQHITTSALVKGSLASIKGQQFTNEGFGTKLFCIAFSIKGLINQIGDENSTKIDGFITFQVIIKEQTQNNVVGKHQMTIQGLMTKSNSNKRLFIVKLPYSHVSGKDRYRVFIKIIDKSIIDDDCTFKVEQLGYRLR